MKSPSRRRVQPGQVCARTQPPLEPLEVSARRMATAPTRRRQQMPERHCPWPSYNDRQSVLFRSAAIDARLVSPAERPCSLSPLKAISVDCTRAPKRRTSSFWLSKSITKYARFLNFGSFVSSFKIGACALQVGHHEAWIATSIGFPAFCASAKACALKG